MGGGEGWRMEDGGAGCDCEGGISICSEKTT